MKPLYAGLFEGVVALGVLNATAWAIQNVMAGDHRRAAIMVALFLFFWSLNLSLKRSRT